MGFEISWLQTRLFDRHGLGSKRATERLIKKIGEIHPDIIHLHVIHGYYLNYKVLFKFLSESNIPVVWTMHDCWAYTGHCVYYTSVNCEKWKTECSHCPVSTSYPQSVLWDRSKHNFRNKNEAFTSLDRKKLVIVPVSKWLADEVEGSFLKKYPIVPIYNGVNTDVFVHSSINKKKYGVDGKFMILGVATQWTERKGIQDFIKLSKFISEDVAIVLVGLTHKQIVGLPSSIIGISKTDNVQQMVELYSSADLYISFSMEETFGLTIAESLSCGTPALVYNTTATPEIVSEETGFIVTPGDFNAVIDVINTVKLHGKTNYSEKCHQRALTFFSKKSKSSDYISLYKSLLGI
ncbi:glycosyltransferase family 4 protein [Bacteroides fragilis]